MKNNLLKRIAAAALAAAAILTCAPTTAMAAAPNTGSVTITKYEGDNQGYEEYGGEQTVQQPGNNLLSHVKFAYVEVGARVQINTGATYEMMYTLKDGVASVLGFPAADHTDNGVNYYQQETLQTALRQEKDDAIKYVKSNKGKIEQETADRTGQVKFERLELDKLYLFAETDATGAKNAETGEEVNITRVSAPFLVSLPFTGKNGNQLYNLNVYPKNATGQETIDKKIVEKGKEVTETQANIGDKINYKVTYSVPVSEYGLAKLVVTDTMGKGLTFDNIVKIKNENDNQVVDNQNYEVSAQGVSGTDTTITITFTEAYLNSLKGPSTQSFTITYGATVNNDAVLGQTGNKNKVYVTYQNKGDAEQNTDYKETKVFTYGIDLWKTDENNANLSNVEFTLTKGSEAASAVSVKVKKVTDSNQNTFYVTDNTADSNTVKTNAEGKIYIRGLEAGTYFLTETKTNTGYVLLKNPVKIVIEQTNSKTGVASAIVDGKNTTMKKDSLNQGSATAEVPLTVVNHKGFDLPATGGAGTALFTIAGIVIVAVAAALLFMRKKSQK